MLNVKPVLTLAPHPWHQEVLRDIDSHAPDVRQTMAMGRKLQRMVSSSEQEALETRLEAVDDRYKSLRDKAKQRKTDLNRALVTSRVFGGK